jgi:hypothetical protein
MEPTNIAIAGKESTQYKMLDSQEREKFEQMWQENKSNDDAVEPEIIKYGHLGDPKIVSFYCSSALYHPDIEKRVLYEQKLVDYIIEVEESSNFDTLNWKLR